MKHTRSSAEVEIRDAVVKRFRELWPDARIIHEMNVEGGSSRADVVAAQPDRLWICEIKSERDKLDRLAGQIKDFGPSCHGLIVAAHEKWTIEGDWITHKSGGMTRVPSPLDSAAVGCGSFETWTFPEPNRPYGRDWRAPFEARIPWYHRMLGLLWADEVRVVASEHRIACSSRTAGYKLRRDLSRMLTGSQIEKAVCKHIRARTFAEADPPILLERKSFPPHPESVRQETIL